MKKNYIMILAALAFAACTSELDNTAPQEPQTPEQEGVVDLDAINFTAQTPETRVAYENTENGISVTWEEDDPVGIFTQVAGQIKYANVAYKASEAGKSTVFTPVADPAKWSSETAEHSFYAYYPYNESVTDVTKIPISVPATQTYSVENPLAEVKANSFIYAVAKGTYNNAVTLSFNHPFSVLELNLDCYNQADVIEKLVIEGPAGSALAVSGATLDLTTGELDMTSATKSNKITLDCGDGVLTDPKETFYFVLAPGLEGVTLTVSAVVDGKTYKVAEKIVPEGGIPANVTARLAGELFTYTYKTYGVKTNYPRTWMTENLNYAGEEGNVGRLAKQSIWKDPNGAICGRFYFFSEALTGVKADVASNKANAYTINIDGFTKDTKDLQVQGACPKGWHVPNHYDFYDLIAGIADDYGLYRENINVVQATNPGENGTFDGGINKDAFTPRTRNLEDKTLQYCGFIASALRGGNYVSNGGLWSDDSTLSEEGYFLKKSPGEASNVTWTANTYYPMTPEGYAAKPEIGFDLLPFGRYYGINDETFNTNGLNSWQWLAAMAQTSKNSGVWGCAVYCISYNNLDLSLKGHQNPEMSVNIRCVKNY